MKSYHCIIVLACIFGGFVCARENLDAGANADKTLLDPAHGTWAWNGDETYFIIEADGKVTQPKRKGHWVCKNPQAATRDYVITWEGEKVVDYFTLRPCAMEATGRNSHGQNFKINRIGPPPPLASQMDSLLVDSEGNRKWTEAKTGRQIIGRLVEKTPEGARIARKENGKGANLIAATLSAADQFFIKHWVSAENQVTARPREIGLIGWKKVTTVIQAGEAPLLVEVTGEQPVPHKFIVGIPRPPFSRIVPTGQRLEFQFASGSTYSVRATANGKPADVETNSSKTGL